MNNRTEFTRDDVRQSEAKLKGALLMRGSIFTSSRSLRCPFHEDSGASGSVFSTDEGDWLYRCHSENCSWHVKGAGDVVEVLQHENLRTLKSAVLVAAVCDEVTGIPDCAVADENEEPPFQQSLNAAQGFWEALCSLPSMQEKLWTTRAIDKETARSLGLGCSPDNNYWTFPIIESKNVVGIKWHRATSDEKLGKGRWMNKFQRAKSINFWPVAVDSDGPIYLCPGELKAAALVALGLPAVGITCGESVGFDNYLLEIVKDRSVFILSDQDEAGLKWAERWQQGLREGGIEADILDWTPLYQGDASGKDVGDLMVQLRVERELTAQQVRQHLEGLTAASDPWDRFSLDFHLSNPETWEPVETLPSGIVEFDRVFEGFEVGGLHVVCGAPGAGKSQFCAQVALNFTKAGTPVGFLSLELHRKRLTHLFCSQLSQIPRSLLKDPTDLDSSQTERLLAFSDGCTGLPLDIIDSELLELPPNRATIERFIRNGVKRCGWKVVVVDYLGLIESEHSDSSPLESERAVSKLFKDLAKDLDIVVLAISALSKDALKRSKKQVPRIADLIGSTALVFDATSVFTCVRGEDGTLIHLSCQKFRWGDLPEEPLELPWIPAYGIVGTITNEFRLPSPVSG